MRDEKLNEKTETVRNYLCGYQFCVDMLNLRKYERRRAHIFDEKCDCEALMMGDEALWRARMYEIKQFLESMKNGREKLILYYHYIKGESIERAASILGVSRRTGYRIHQKGLLTASVLYEKKIRNESFVLE